MITVNQSRSHIQSDEHGDVVYECVACSAGYGRLRSWNAVIQPLDDPCWFCGGEEFGISLMSLGASGSWWDGWTGERNAPASEAA